MKKAGDIHTHCWSTNSRKIQIKKRKTTEMGQAQGCLFRDEEKEFVSLKSKGKKKLHILRKLT